MPTRQDLRPVKILLVEDDLGDQKLIKRSLLNQKISNEIFSCESGEETLEYLTGSKAGDSEHPMPDLILLDLNMPGMGGKEFLRQIKTDDKLDTIPVVILTTSDSDQDILESYKLHASGYIQKPVTMQDFHTVIEELQEYWFTICRRIPKVELTCTKS